MAFRPFEVFRKRSKAMMAALVLVAMFSFIFIGVIPNVGGEGTIIGNWFRRLFGQEEKVFSIDGTGYGVDKTRDLVARRRLAYQFLQAYFNAAESNIVQKYATTSNTATESSKKEQEDALARLRHGVCFRTLTQRYSVESQWQLSRLGRGENRAPEETLEFAYYLKRADDLGIVIPHGRVLEDLLESSARTIREGDLPGLMLRWGVSASVDATLEAVGDEIRANLARLVLSGDSPRQAALSIQPTPRDLLDGWIHLAVDAKTALVEFKAENFADQVPAPEEKVLKDFFDKYKRDLPNPASEKPGFKIPPLYQIEYVYADVSKGIHGGARAYYANKAAELRRVQLALSPIRLQVGQETPAFGPLHVKVPIWIGASTLAQYEAEKGKHLLKYLVPRVPAVLHLYPSTRLADGTFYFVPARITDASKLTHPQIEAINAGAAVLALSPGLVPLEPTRSVIVGVNSASPMAVRVYHENPVPYPAILGPGTLDAGVLPIVIDAVRVIAQNEETTEATSGFKFRRIEDVYRDVLEAETEAHIRGMLAHDLDQLGKNLAAHGVRYRYWYQKKLAAEKPAAKGPVPPEPLFRDLFQNVKPFDLLLEQGPVELARTQALPHEEPLGQYLARWAGERGIHLMSRDEFGKPRSALDLLKPLGGANPMGLLYAHLLELEKRSRAEPPPENETERQREIVVRNILGPRFVVAGDSESGSRPMEAPWPVFEPRWAMTFNDRHTHGDAAGSPLFERPRGVGQPSEKPAVVALFWKTTETEARTPEFHEDGVRETVLKAYRLEHAREAARKAADDLVAMLKGRPLADVLSTLRDLDKDHPGRVKFDASWRRFKWDRLKNTYSPDRPPPFIQYPAADTIETGLENLKLPGDSMVIANAAKSHYYAVVLQERFDQTVASFDRDLIAREKVSVMQPHPQFGVEFPVDFHQWVLGRKQDSLHKQWTEYLRAKTGYDPESSLGKFLVEIVKSGLLGPIR